MSRIYKTGDGRRRADIAYGEAFRSQDGKPATCGANREREKAENCRNSLGYVTPKDPSTPGTTSGRASSYQMTFFESRNEDLPTSSELVLRISDSLFLVQAAGIRIQT